MASRGWYPGHMVATQKTIREIAPFVTAFIEVVDARAPLATAHHALQTWVGRTPLLQILNKAELADPAVTENWLGYYGRVGNGAIAISAHTPQARRILEKMIRQQFAPPFRLSVVGMPNVGKSTLLNTMVGRHRVMTGAKPGLTRGPQWIRPGDGWEWLDLPGVITPGRSDDWRLKALGVVAVAADDVQTLGQQIADLFPNLAAQQWLEWGRRRGFLRTGGVVDTMRTAQALIRDFQAGRLGRLSLELPPPGQAQ